MDILLDKNYLASAFFTAQIQNTMKYLRKVKKLCTLFHGENIEMYFKDTKLGCDASPKRQCGLYTLYNLATMLHIY